MLFDKKMKELADASGLEGNYPKQKYTSELVRS